jgi:hypothetical protein
VSSDERWRGRKFSSTFGNHSKKSVTRNTCGKVVE